MVTAFQSNAFQNNAFQINASKDTHDYDIKRKKDKKIFLPIYEYTKKPEALRADNIEEIELDDKEITVEKPAARATIMGWDNSRIEAHAKATSQSIAQVEKKLAVLQAYEKELDDEEEEFLMMVARMMH